jgi:hypothetical protein
VAILMCSYCHPRWPEDDQPTLAELDREEAEDAERPRRFRRYVEPPVTVADFAPNPADRPKE